MALLLLNFNIDFDHMGILTTLEKYTICTSPYEAEKGWLELELHTGHYELLNAGTQIQLLHKSSKCSETQSRNSSLRFDTLIMSNM